MYSYFIPIIYAYIMCSLRVKNLSIFGTPITTHINTHKHTHTHNYTHTHAPITWLNSHQKMLGRNSSRKKNLHLVSTRKVWGISRMLKRTVYRDPTKSRVVYLGVNVGRAGFFIGREGFITSGQGCFVVRNLVIKVGERGKCSWVRNLVIKVGERGKYSWVRYYVWRWRTVVSTWESFLWILLNFCSRLYSC